MMVKVPPPRGKGEPPASSGTLGNLDKPESQKLVSLNFRVPRAFRQEFRLRAAHDDRDMVEILFAAFAALKNAGVK
jgi:hypothetical protein